MNMMMGIRRWFGCALVLVMGVCTCTYVSSMGGDEVPFTPLPNATEKRAVCIDGSAAGYHYAVGHGDGANNWLVYLMGGGWCPDNAGCEANRSSELGSTRFTKFATLTGILSKHQYINPDFYNWNRVYVVYCDQSSFLGDTQIDGRNHSLQFRGSTIFDAVIEDLMAKGMSNANYAILGGRSAGGLAAILHCDDFRARLPNAGRLKCISDAGFFIRAKDVRNADYREHFFASTIMFHNISSLLPKACTNRIDPTLCLFPEYLVGDVQTPLFLLNSAFDFYQIQNKLVPQESSDWDTWNMCVKDLINCPATHKQLIKDFGMAFHNAINEIPENPSRALFIHACFTHTVSMYVSDMLWNTLTLKNTTLIHAIGNWYFDRGSVKLQDTDHDFPQFCT